ncbi:hypothetical protein DERF_008989 [Dermatophagoides farinae]|uniref:CCHC-type domain-containing protein n=1 Tax=Dermatophagoides farinae TaxID=6954 RepID=A0A922HT45_DERFA|nr:hypothetical protein DERF_008989 [Dermatophagoides farinae]
MSFFKNHQNSANSWLNFFKEFSSVHGNTSINTFKEKLLKFGVFFESFIQGIEGDYAGIERNFNKSSEYIDGLKKELKTVKQEMAKVKESKTTAENNLKFKCEELERIKNIKSYAQVASSLNQSRDVPQPNFTCIIESVDPSIQDSKQALSYLNSKLDNKKISENGIKINRQIPIHGKKVLIKCPTSNDCSKIEKLVNDMNGGVKARVLAKKKPRLLLLGIERDIPDDGFKDALLAQNVHLKCLMNGSNELIDLVMSKNDRVGSKFAIFSVSPNIYRLCLDMKFLFIGHKACVVKKGDSVIQCFKCLRFGHTNRVCANDPVCKYCHHHHISNECPNASREIMSSCSNCKSKNLSRRGGMRPFPVDHSVFSKDCPQYLLAEKRLNESIDYGC